MSRFYTFSSNNAYLGNTNTTRKRNSLKLIATLGVVLGVCVLFIWVFTPVSQQTVSPSNKVSDQSSAYSGDLFDTREDVQFNALSALMSSFQTNITSDQIDVDALNELIRLNSFIEEISPDLANSTKQADYSLASEWADTGSNLANHTVTFDSFIREITPNLASNTNQSDHHKTFIIRSGDTLINIFKQANLPVSQAIKLSQNKKAKPLGNLSIGNVLNISFDTNNQWQTLEYDINKLETLVVSPNKSSFKINTFKKEVEYHQFTAHGVIETSLSAAAEKAGISRSLSRKLTDIYKWEIDFARGLHVGDTFSVIYQKAFVNGKSYEDGPILAASFNRRGKVMDAVRYTDSNDVTGYFQPSGESLRRGFLRTPVKLARITSAFGNRRHPIKKVWKKHNGVDYGARRGTPIISTADGMIQYAGKKGGYGKTVILRHGGIYTTLYAHMSKFAKGVRTGKSVSQGQIIGYVGRTGWATGDHLHYEFRINGHHKNPLKVKLPRRLPLAKKEVKSFNKQAEPLLTTLTSLQGARVAGTAK